MYSVDLRGVKGVNSYLVQQAPQWNEIFSHFINVGKKGECNKVGKGTMDGADAEKVS